MAATSPESLRVVSCLRGRSCQGETPADVVALRVLVGEEVSDAAAPEVAGDLSAAQRVDLGVRQVEQPLPVAGHPACGEARV